MSNESFNGTSHTQPFDWAEQSTEFMFTPVDGLLVNYHQLTATSIAGVVEQTKVHKVSLQESVVGLFEIIDSGINPFKGYSEDDTLASFGVVEAHLRTNLGADEPTISNATKTMLDSMKTKPVGTDQTEVVSVAPTKDTVALDLDAVLFEQAIKPNTEAIQNLRRDAKILSGLLRLEDSVNNKIAIRNERNSLARRVLAVSAVALAFLTFTRNDSSENNTEKASVTEYVMPNSLPAPFETNNSVLTSDVVVATTTPPTTILQETVASQELTPQPEQSSMPSIPTTISSATESNTIFEVTPEVSTDEIYIVHVEDGDGFERLFKRQYGLTNEQAARLSNLLFVELSMLPGTYLDKETDSVRIGNVDSLDFSSINEQVISYVTQIRFESL